MEIELSSDLNQKPVYSEGGVEWLPVDNDNEDNTRSFQKSISDTESQSNDGDVGADETPIILQPINNGLLFC
jgi:hypothetical protein